MNITTDRQKQISIIHYLDIGQSMVVAKGNPENITAPTDLCGKSVAAESGTTEVDYLQGTGDYKGKGLPAELHEGRQAAAHGGCDPERYGCPPAIAGGQGGLSTSPIRRWRVSMPFSIQISSNWWVSQSSRRPSGIGVPCGVGDCTSAPLTPLGQAVQTALKSMMADGTYAKILEKWNGAKDSAVTLP